MKQADILKLGFGANASSLLKATVMQGRDIAIAVAVIAGVILLISLLGLISGWMMGPWMMGQPFVGGFWWMWIMMAFFWVLIIGGVVWLVVRLTQQAETAGAGPRTRGGRALEILRERYARGEISRDEYERMRRDLEE